MFILGLKNNASCRIYRRINECRITSICGRLRMPHRWLRSKRWSQANWDEFFIDLTRGESQKPWQPLRICTAKKDVAISSPSAFFLSLIRCSFMNRSSAHYPILPTNCPLIISSRRMKPVLFGSLVIYLHSLLLTQKLTFANLTWWIVLTSSLYKGT